MLGAVNVFPQTSLHIGQVPGSLIALQWHLPLALEIPPKPCKYSGDPIDGTEG